MLLALRVTASATAALAGMCSLSCDSAFAGLSSLHARRIAHMVSLRNYKRVAQSSRGMAHLLQHQPPPPAHRQRAAACRHSMQHSCFAASVVPQPAPDTAAVNAVISSGRSRRHRRSTEAGGDDGSASAALGERLEQLAGAEPPPGPDAVTAWERQPAQKQHSSGRGARSKSRRAQRRQRESHQHPSPAARQKPPPMVLKAGSDQHAIRSPSLICNSDIPSHAWIVMRKLKDAGDVH